MKDLYLPDPCARISGRKFWRRRAVREYLARVSGEPAPAPQSDDEFFMGSLELRMVLGGVSDMWLHRHSRRNRSAAAPTAPQSAA